ncbi:MAG: hypothetical protein GC171_00105 [Terrimonas sp.]|nr:hypothetical protein [Terrimonas sp.]
MKRIFKNNRVLVIAFFTAFTVSAITGTAQEPGKSLPVSLTYAGSLHDQPLYKLSVAGNTQLDQFAVSILDANGNLLYSENIKAEHFTKSFLLNTDEIGDDNLYFEITSKKTKESVTYEINRYSHLEEQMAVSLAK